MEDLPRNKLQALYLSGEREIPVFRTAESPRPDPPATTSGAAGDPSALLEKVRQEIGDCTRCRLCEQRKHIVFGVGNSRTDLMFVGEAPGHDEDVQGEPFVGRAGQLLNRIIEAMKLKREDVYIANCVKCRPPENRNPAPDEIATCEPFLLRQIEIIQPKVIVCLGKFAAQTLLQTETPISRLRGKFQPWPSALVKATFETSIPEGSVKLMPTYHPAFLLRNPNMKRPVWEDMQKVMEELQLK
jgi:DNA polymerase